MPRVTRKVAPVVASNTINTNDEQVGQEQVATMSSKGPARIEHSEIEVVSDKRATKDKLETLAFMEELVSVEVHPSSDQFSPQFTEVGNGGRKFVFPHGIRVNAPRKFVEVLARSKRKSYKNVEYTDAEGVVGFKWPSHQGLQHPFSVYDDTPRGREWLRKILAEAA